ncbi:hypothetical protein DTO012A9_10311 [Penicillium roqueforti]|nr:hypothetical protein DTO012A9_10311 [Penicillium roqueforti]
MPVNEQSFLNYPPTLEGPNVPYKYEDQVLPVFRGVPLAIGATLIHNIGFIQSHFWRNAGFGVIREIPHLGQYAGRYDPTVIPVDNTTQAEAEAKAASAVVERRKGDHGYYTSADYHAIASNPA